MFVDEIRILVESGTGGNGAIHFRREKYVPRGGPDGGDGGAGGNVVLQVEPRLNTLSAFRKTHRFKAEDGVRGRGKNMTGRTGEDTLIKVPPGTIVYLDESSVLLGDMVEPHQQLVVARGGRGGKGSARFATSTNQAPRMAEKGEPGEEKWLRFELKLIADVGIVGLPNAGKSTLLAAVTNAKPKIADYPFTTLEPNLGVADLNMEVQLVLADIPGLIEGAHQGVGLGFSFLRHIQRTKVIIHLIDGSSLDPLADFAQINTEMALFDDHLAEKPQVVAITKIDMPEIADILPDLQAAFREHGQEVMGISGLAHKNLMPLLWAAYHAMQDLPEELAQQEEIPVYTAEEDPGAFTISRDIDGTLRISGAAIERAAAMTYWEYEEAVRRFMKTLEYLGVEEALREAGAREGDTVRIAEFEFEWTD